MIKHIACALKQNLKNADVLIKENNIATNKKVSFITKL